MEWLDRMKDAIDLIESKLADVTVAEYIRKRRLTLAAQDLSMFPTRVLDVALKYGYDSPESFAKAFRKAHGISPSEARGNGANLKAYPRISFHLSLKGDKEMDYKIVNREGFSVIGKMFRVSCKDGENFRRIPEFWKEWHADGTIERLGTLYPGKDVLGICMDMDHDSEELTYGIGVEGPPTLWRMGSHLEIFLPALGRCLLRSVHCRTLFKTCGREYSKSFFLPLDISTQNLLS